MIAVISSILSKKLTENIVLKNAFILLSIKFFAYKKL